MPRARICCLDLDTFFVSVERLLDPALVGQPVVVGGRKGERGVVTAASYEVRPLGVRSGMPMTEAVRLAPHAIFVPTRHGVYGPYARQVRGVLERYCPEVRTASIDEFFLDFSGCERLYRRTIDSDDDAAIERVVREMREAIQREVGLPASAGIGTTRPIAKMASGRAKPAGVLMIRAGEEEAFVRDLPVRRYPGIGPVAEVKLAELGITTLGQLLDAPSAPHAAMLRRGVSGEQEALPPNRPAFQEHDPEGLSVGSISNERTFFADVRDVSRIEGQLLALVERVCWRARKREVRARTITLRLRYADFHTLTRGRTIAPTDEEAIVLRTILDLLHETWNRRPVRLLGVALSGLVPKHDGQLVLPVLDGPRPGAAIDAIRERFGYDAVRLGATKPRDRGSAS